MKLRSVLLLFASVLLIGRYAAAAPAPSSCGLNYTRAKLPAVTSPVVNKSAGETCGACSTPVCRGVAWGSGGCNLRNPSATCIDALATTCDDGTPQCQCWSGPLP
jgi:hypothetical protein